MKLWAVPLKGATDDPEMAMVGTRAVTSVPKGTVKAIVWLPSVTIPVTAGDKALKLKAVMALAALA